MKQLVISMSLFATSLFAVLPSDHDGHQGSYLSDGIGKVTHDGDFVEFYLSFDAKCYADRAHAWGYVTQNVDVFINWLASERDQHGENIAWEIDPLSSWHNDSSPYLGECADTYNASQTVKLTFNKWAGSYSLYADDVQDFYARLQETIWPLSHSRTDESSSSVHTTINNIEKGISEETANNLRIAAKAKAQANATQDFLAFLGVDYTGYWYLQRVEFTESNSSPYYRMAVETSTAGEVLPPAPGGIGDLPAPAQLKLKPWTTTLSGRFLFKFDID